MESPKTKLIEQIEHQSIVEKAKQYKLIGRIRPTVDGQNNFWEYDTETQKLIKATIISYQNEVYDPTNKHKNREGSRGKLCTRPNCIYVEAINLVNAKKKLIKGNWIAKT